MEPHVFICEAVPPNYSTLSVHATPNSYSTQMNSAPCPTQRIPSPLSSGNKKVLYAIIVFCVFVLSLR